MKEVEVLMRVNSGAEGLEERLRQQAKFVGAVVVDDQYYFDPLRHEQYFSPEGRFISSFRLRQKDGKARVTHKADHFDDVGLWTYSDELETEVGDYDTFQKLIETLGFEKLVCLEIVKKTFLTDDYEIVLEEVKDLGIFIEIEALHVDDGVDVEALKNKIRQFARDLGVEGEEELLMGKVELLWLKQKDK